nr:anaerobic glycerol-3-phosphate dehydrogenase subunit GlpB [Desulforadius tongensis]
MNKKADVLVIGAGLSGLMAAAKAVEQGKKVLLVAKGMGALGLSSGCIDLWGYDIDQPDQVCSRPLQEIDKLIQVNPHHPYARVRDVLEESLDFFRKICAENGSPYLENEGGNWLLPTALGTMRPTYLVPASMAVKSLEEADKILVVGFKGLKDFYPDVLVANLQRNAELKPSCKLEPVLVEVGSEELKPAALAHRLERGEIIDKIVQQVKPLLSPGAVVLFPPVLGSSGGAGMAGRLADELGCPVYEVSNIPPALPGDRLQKTLLHHLKTRGVEVIIGSTVTTAHLEGNRCVKVTVRCLSGTMTISARVFVLATGSFLGGGLEADIEGIKESIFNLPVQIGAEEWSVQEFLDLKGQPFNKFGIAVNDHLQPVDESGQVLVKNLMVTGANLAGCNYPIEKCGNGVALATGYKAGKLVEVVHGE